MKLFKVIFFALSVFFAQNSFAGSYVKYKNSAIKGHNVITANKHTVQQCRALCDGHSWCRSFDYHKKSNKCDLSDHSYYLVPLKNDYPGNPYDHYMKMDVEVNPELNKYRFSQNAAIKGYNRVKLSSRSVKSCRLECDNEPWCVSFDYHKKTSKCDLSAKSAGNGDKLKTNYPGNPYDHYYKK